MKLPANEALRTLVDDLSRSLQRSVVINDQAVRLIYASPHYGDEDPARIRAVLYGDGGAALAGWILAQGVNQWRKPHVLEANAEFGMESRYCVPLFGSGWLLGHMMIIDADHSLSADERLAIDHASADIAAQLYADRIEAEPQYVERRRRVAALLGEEPVAREEARATFEQETGLGNTRHSAVTAVHLQPGEGTRAPLEMALKLALEIANQTHSRRSLHLVDGDRAWLLQADMVEISRTALQAQADRICAELNRSPAKHSRVSIGVGTASGGLARAWLARQRADLALRAATLAVSGQPATVMWDDLGAEALLLRLPDTDLVMDNVPLAIRKLKEEDHSGKLLETLSDYLDQGGSIAATARSLHLHRTSLYYRLDQIRKITGADLDNGRQRLELHLGLTLLRLVNARILTDK